MSLIKAIESIIKGKEIASISEPGAHIEVRERKNERTLFYNGITFSRIKKGTLFTNGYWDYFMPLPRLFHEPHVLILGLGGGTVPYQLESLYSGISIDAVEINPSMLKLVNAFLPAKLSARIIIADGADYIKSMRNSYDIIILDTYINTKMPNQFMGADFVNNASQALKSRGMLAINYALSADNALMFGNYCDALRKQFTIGVANAYNLGNKIIVCLKGIYKNELDNAIAGFSSQRIANDYTKMEMQP